MTGLLLLVVVGAQQLPDPFETPWTRAIPTVVERPETAELLVPAGFEATVFAEGLRAPRRMVLAPNGDIFVTLSRAGEVVVLRDANADGVAEPLGAFVADLDRPFGLAFHDRHLYVAQHDAVLRFDYEPGQVRASAPPRYVVALPPSDGAVDQDTADRLGVDLSRTRGFNHWTRNLVIHPDGSTMYVGIGSATNVTPGEDPRRAAINEYRLDGSEHRVFAEGMRNPVGLAFHPHDGRLWAVVQERDHLGDGLVPDFVTSVGEGSFYGWPYAYIGPNPEPSLDGSRDDLVEATRVPDVLLPAHSAALGLTFYTADQFPASYREGAFVALHGSINRSDLTGYAVVHVPFTDGRPSGEPEAFLSGFILRDDDRKEVWARPVDVLVASDGSLLVSDDAGGRIFRVRHTGDPSGPTR